IGIAGIADKVKLRPIDDVNPITGKATLSMTMRALEVALRFKKDDVILFAAGYPYEQKTALLFKRVLEKVVKRGILFLTAASNEDDADGMEELILPCSLANGIQGVLCIAATTASDLRLVLEHPAPMCGYQHRSETETTAGGMFALMKSFNNFKLSDIERILLNCTEGRVRTKNRAEMLYGVLRSDLAVSQAIAEARWGLAA
ncbi:hypothetical protein FOZ62_032163, partial [Perkinsus olseni]